MGEAGKATMRCGKQQPMLGQCTDFDVLATAAALQLHWEVTAPLRTIVSMHLCLLNEVL